MKNTTIIIQSFLLMLIMSGCSVNTVVDDSESESKVEINGVQCFENMREAQIASRQSGKPIFAIFDSPNVGCCRKSTDLVFKFLKKNSATQDKYELVYLCLDDKTKVNSGKELEIGGKRKKVKTVGDENLFLMIEMFDLATSYYYVVLDAELKITKEPIGFFSDEESINDYL